MTLPSLNEHDGQAKLTPLTGPVPPGPTIAAWLESVAPAHGRAPVRVLDVGCGRGGTVAWLLEKGYDAYGIDVREEYVANGIPYVGAERLVVLDSDRYPFPSEHFDVVMSDQVLEHVADLGQLAREVSRTTTPGGVGLHVFPARWIWREPHLHAPLVHWLAPGRLRRSAIRLALRTGHAAPYFAELSLDERTEIFAHYSETETFYRPLRVIRDELAEAGLLVDLQSVSRQRVLGKLRRTSLPFGLDRVAAWAYRHTRVVYLATAKPGASARR